MNAQLTEKLAGLPDALSGAKNVEEIAAVVSDVEALVRSSNLETHSGPAAPYVAEDYLVGERNTRGLSWKLDLLRTISSSTFCRLQRIGVHGGTTKILGQQDNVDATKAIFEALVPVLDETSKKAYTSYSDGRAEDDSVPAVHRVGWINKFLLDAPAEIGASLTSDAEFAGSSNKAIANMAVDKAEELSTFHAVTFPKAEPKPKKEKVEGEEPAPAAEGEDGEVRAASPKSKKKGKGTPATEENGEESDSASED